MSSPLENPMVRYGIGLSGALVLVVVGVLYFDGLMRYLVFGMAVLDAVVVPKILEMAVEGDGQPA
ncbi:hypothetical protein G9C85_16115 [Halorubellus sp. JP-L1]|uniref:hypothetical protein n=1 Tax=Halorubellus sp. JP-L1 TaxID=2715753 RepID=UPI00140971F8|nr:hypothetical protein [Halorubellus sp. JP-L1]NHN43144.1 hypothetical protein [Halorubellus sp. JP-L1]